MKRMALLTGFFFLLSSLEAFESHASSKQSLQVFQDLIGSWKGTGVPQGTREQREKGFWVETITWQWQFKGKDIWLLGEIDKGKHYKQFELRYLPETKSYQLKAKTCDDQTFTYTGTFASKRLTVERHDQKSKQTQRLVFSLLHFNRHLYRYEVKQADRTTFSQIFQVGATKEGVAFATEDKGPECIVSGGLGTMPVTHKGKTYYVCCTGCRDAFREDPEKYIKEFEESKKKK